LAASFTATDGTGSNRAILLSDPCGVAGSPPIPAILGRDLASSTASCSEVVGVMPAVFVFPNRTPSSGFR
jgi:hypothetical protein